MQECLIKKGRDMPYARVNMAEFKSREEMDRTIGQLRNNIKSIYPEIRAFASMETSETSQLTISVYDDKDAADRALEQRRKHMEDTGVADFFAHEGRVNCFYVEAEHVDGLLKSGS